MPKPAEVLAMVKMLPRGTMRRFRTWWPHRTATIPAPTRRAPHRDRPAHRIRKVPTKRELPSLKIVNSSRESCEVIAEVAMGRRPQKEVEAARTIRARWIGPTIHRRRCSRAVPHRRQLQTVETLPVAREEARAKERTATTQVPVEGIIRMATRKPGAATPKVHPSPQARLQPQQPQPVATPAPPPTNPINRTRPARVPPLKRPSIRASVKLKPAKIKRPPPATAAAVPPLRPLQLQPPAHPPTMNARKSKTKPRMSTRTINPSPTATRCS